MTPQRRRAIWLGLYAMLVIGLPGLALTIDPRTAPRSWTTALSLGLAFEVFVILLVQFALVSRLAPISRAIGSDALTRLHRNMGLAALVGVLVHPLLLDVGWIWRSWSPFHGSPGMRAGAVAVWILAAVIVTSIARRRFRLSYEGWQIIHLAGACGLVVAALAHMLLVGEFARVPAMRWTLAAYTAIFLALLVRSRLVRPFRMARRPWRIVSNDDIGASTRLLRVRPVGHDGFTFESGQFAWLITGRSPLWSGQHPLSIATSDRRPADGAIEFAIKALGDWSSTVVPGLAAGQRVFVDGPFGAFTPELSAGAPLVLVAGGIGIAPMRSMLLSLRDRRDQRPVVLFYAVDDLSRAAFRGEIDGLSKDLALTVVYVLERPAADWTGERGFLTADIVRRYAPAGIERADCFICGPVPMMDAVQTILTGLGVPTRQIHSERFQVV